VEREGTVSLSDYRGKTPVLLAVFRGVYCPFCRRAIAQLGMTREKLKAVGVEALGIVGTTPERARLFFRFRPTRLPLVADPELTTHRAYGVPRPELTPQLKQAYHSVRVNADGELPEPLLVPEASAALDRLDSFEPTETDLEDRERQFPQLEGQFLVDREGIVRWVHIECSEDGLAGVGKVPTDEEILAAARALPS
jgi:alkyl hydroperoxide reductase subunit AhpC